MIFEVKVKGRPKGSTKQEVKVLTPENKEGFMKLRRGQRTMAPVHEAKRKSEQDLAKAQEILKLQNKYFEEFEAIDYNRYGMVMEHPTKPELGKILIAAKNATGLKLQEYYFPEKFSEEKKAKQLQRLKTKLNKQGVTAHDLRMRRVPEEVIQELFE